MRYAFIEEQRTQHSVRRMCHLLNVSPAGYYEWRNRPPSTRAIADNALSTIIVHAHMVSRRTYGRPRIFAELGAQGIAVGEKRVGRLMKKARIAGIRPRRFQKTTHSNHKLPIAENILARQFDVTKIGTTNRVWAGDITYIPTREGWLYLAVILDLVSRRVIGWSMQATMERNLVIDALKSAISRRRMTHGTLFHSDRGSQYASEDFRDVLKVHGLKPSMSRKGECWDNAVVESFFGTLKTELGDPIWESRAVGNGRGVLNPWRQRRFEPLIA